MIKGVRGNHLTITADVNIKYLTLLDFSSNNKDTFCRRLQLKVVVITTRVPHFRTRNLNGSRKLEVSLGCTLN